MKKITINSLVLLLILVNIAPKKTIAQNDNAAAIAGFALLATSIAAVEEYKEVLETNAAEYIMKNYPDYREFQIKIIGSGDDGGAVTNQGSVAFIPFSFIEMKDGELTGNKRLLFCLASQGWVNQYGVDYNKIHWEFWSKNKWNSLLKFYSNINSPIELKNTNDIPVFKRIQTYEESINTTKKDMLISLSKKSDYSQIKDENILIIKRKSNKLNFNKNSASKLTRNKKKLFFDVYVLQEDSFISIQDVRVTSMGLKQINKLGGSIFFPFYDLGYDDYILGDYSESMRVFVTEDALGLFLKNISKSNKNNYSIKANRTVLISNFLLNKIHRFINN